MKSCCTYTYVTYIYARVRHCHLQANFMIFDWVYLSSGRQKGHTPWISCIPLEFVLITVWNKRHCHQLVTNRLNPSLCFRSYRTAISSQCTLWNVTDEWGIIIWNNEGLTVVGLLNHKHAIPSIAHPSIMFLELMKSKRDIYSRDAGFWADHTLSSSLLISKINFWSKIQFVISLVQDSISTNNDIKNMNFWHI